MKKSLLRRLAAILCLSAMLAACAPALPTVATPADAVFVTPGDLVTPADYVTPSDYVSPSNYATPSNAEVIPAGLDTSLYPALTQELLDTVMATFFESADVKYFTFGESSAEDSPNVWIDKPIIKTETTGTNSYETMDAKAYQDGVVYDMWSYHDVGKLGFNLAIYGRNLMTPEEIEKLRPTDGMAWMSLQQGALSGDDPAVLEQEAEKAIPLETAVEKTRALLTAVGITVQGDPNEITASYRIRYVGDDENEAAKAEREYGWIIQFGPLPYEVLQIGVTAAGYAQFYWGLEF